MKKRQFTEEQERAMGEKLAETFRLRKSPDHADRYLLGDGYLDKTALGVFRTVRHIGEMIEQGKYLP